MNELQPMVKIRPTLVRALENHAKTAAQATAPTNTPPASAIPSTSIFLNKEFPVTISVVKVAANTISGIPTIHTILTYSVLGLELKNIL